MLDALIPVQLPSPPQSERLMRQLEEKHPANSAMCETILCIGLCEIYIEINKGYKIKSRRWESLW